MTKVRDRQVDGGRFAARRGATKIPQPGSDRARRQNDLLDEGLEETFPASDPVSIVRVE